MTSADPRAFGFAGPFLAPLADNWWLILLRGIVAILFGIVAFVWPGVTLATLVLLYGAFALVDGVFAIGAAIRGGTMAPRWWLVIVGLAGIGAGLLAALWPGITALVLITFIGAWSIVRGAFEIIGAFRLRREIDNEWMLILAGTLSVLFGVFVIIAPGAGALALLWLIGVYAFASGLMLVGLALRLRSHRRPA